MVEGAALEMLYRGNSIEGSNPSLSASPPALGPVFLWPDRQGDCTTEPGDPDDLAPCPGQRTDLRQRRDERADVKSEDHVSVLFEEARAG